MMDGAFFVGRKEIMDWVNGTLELNLSKVEDTCNGAVACQLLDIMYPNQGINRCYYIYMRPSIYCLILINTDYVHRQFQCTKLIGQRIRHTNM